MQLTRGRFLFLVVVAAGWLGWQHLSSGAYETVVLHIPPTARSQDTYVSLWMVDDGRNAWIRAESPGRLWLEYLREQPEVELRRSGRTERFRAIVQDDPDTRAYVDEMFRAKYGVVDQARALLRDRTVPIRLARP
jgi:hypothetical protein